MCPICLASMLTIVATAASTGVVTLAGVATLQRTHSGAARFSVTKEGEH